METFAAPLVRVVLTGSESVGKSTLALQLAERYGVECVPEFVRSFAAQKGAPLDFRDHGPIAKGQMALEDEYIARATRLLVQDTDLMSTVVYCHHYFGKCPAFIEEEASRRMATRYLLLDIDVPWVADGVRDRRDRRQQVQELFAETLARFAAPVTVVRGDWANRLAVATKTVDELLHDPAL